MRRGLYRIELPGVGECARVPFSLGDAAPFLDRETYGHLKLEPAFDQLPTRQDYETRLPQLRDARPRIDDIWSDPV